MNFKRLFILALALTAAGAFALTDPLVELVNTIRPTWFQSGIYIGPASVNPPGDTANKVTRILGGSATIDFASQTITCNTSTVTVTGAQTGDPCFVGPPSTGGAANSSFTCYVSAANTVTVKHCPAGTASDPASASYAVRVISNQ